MSDFQLPHNDDCERTVLGVMLMSDKACLDAITDLTEEDFFENNFSHRAVFRAIKSLSINNLPIDIATVNDYLIKAKISSQIGGVDFLVELTNYVTGFKNIDYYIGLLKDYSLMRRLIGTLEEIKSDSEKANVEGFSKFVGEAEAKITRVTAERKISGFESSKKIAGELGREIEQLDSGNNFSGITTGFKALDNTLNGLQKGSLVVLAARPSVGKTALGINIAYQAALKTNRPVAIFSIEMSNSEIMKRLFANRATVPLDKINKGYLNKDDRLKLREAEEEISKVPLYIDDTGGISLEDLVSKAKKLKSDLGDLALIVVDYIGKINVKLKSDNKVLEIDRITGTLKQLARNLDLPVLALAQVNRHVEDRDSAIPELSNLKDSGSIEQDADQVMFIYNPNQASAARRNKSFNKQQGENKDEDDDLPNPQVTKPDNGPDNGELVQVMVKKNRNGKLDNIFLLFFKAYQRFDTPSPEAIEEFKKYTKN